LPNKKPCQIIPLYSIAITYAAKGCSFIAHIKVGSEVNNLQGESTVWTYCARIFSLTLCVFPSVGLQCVLVSRRHSTWLTCNCVNVISTCNSSNHTRVKN